MTRKAKYDGAAILALPMEDNDSGAKTVRGYLVELVRRVWGETEGFSGKRPFGNSGWTRDLAEPLVAAKVINGELSEDGFVDDVDETELSYAIFAAIDALEAA
jgi:hypothetical protein